MCSSDGSYYVFNGLKIFIINGWYVDVVIVVVCIMLEGGVKGMSFFVVDMSMEGFSKGKCLKKVGMKVQDIVELFFDNVWVLVVNLFGEEYCGFVYLMQELLWECLQIVIGVIVLVEGVFEWILCYVCECQVFGKFIFDFQIVWYVLVELKIEVQIGCVFVDQCIVFKLVGKFDVVMVFMVKYWIIDLQFKVMDCCV